jgi:hypothetical protein
MWWIKTTLLIVLLLVGCASPRSAAVSTLSATDPHRYIELVPGVSTTTDATHILGAPNAYSALAQGQSLLQWTEFYGPHGIHVAILFDADGRMIRVQHVTVL